MSFKANPRDKHQAVLSCPSSLTCLRREGGTTVDGLENTFREKTGTPPSHSLQPHLSPRPAATPAPPMVQARSDLPQPLLWSRPGHEGQVRSDLPRPLPCHKPDHGGQTADLPVPRAGTPGTLACQPPTRPAPVPLSQPQRSSQCHPPSPTSHGNNTRGRERSLFLHL